MTNNPTPQDSDYAEALAAWRQLTATVNADTLRAFDITRESYCQTWLRNVYGHV